MQVSVTCCHFPLPFLSLCGFTTPSTDKLLLMQGLPCYVCIPGYLGLGQCHLYSYSLCKEKIFFLLQMFNQEQHWPKNVKLVLKLVHFFFLDKSGQIWINPAKKGKLREYQHDKKKLLIYHNLKTRPEIKNKSGG